MTPASATRGRVYGLNLATVQRAANRIDQIGDGQSVARPTEALAVVHLVAQHDVDGAYQLADHHPPVIIAVSRAYSGGLRGIEA